MSSPTPRYRKTDGLRLRPVPEMRMCIAFTPADPELYTLNTNAWLIMELADGHTPAELEATYLAHTAASQSRSQADRSLKEGLSMLITNGIVTLLSVEK